MPPRGMHRRQGRGRGALSQGRARFAARHLAVAHFPFHSRPFPSRLDCSPSSSLFHTTHFLTASAPASLQIPTSLLLPLLISKPFPQVIPKEYLGVPGAKPVTPWLAELAGFKPLALGISGAQCVWGTWEGWVGMIQLNGCVPRVSLFFICDCTCAGDRTDNVLYRVSRGVRALSAQPRSRSRS